MLEPISASQWNHTKAAHLLNRAGFGGTPADIEKLVKLGPEKAVASLVDYEQIPDSTPNPAWAKPDVESRMARRQRLAEVTAKRKAELKKVASEDERLKIQREIEEERRKLQSEERRTEFERIAELRGWWLQRMATGPRPLQEKLTLFWHGHFATSFEKVRDAYFMFLQNDTFRRNASGSWRTMLREVTEDPAMLIWLDQAQSNKQHPNENYAREVMELFALGEGHYTEKDILEAARALTGLTLDRQSLKTVFRDRNHDEGIKTVLGKTGNLGVQDVLDAILEQPQAAKFVAFKMWRFFASEAVPQDIADSLGEVFRKNDYKLKPLLRTMFLSEEFYAPEVMHSQVKSPVQWMVSAARALNASLPPGRVAGPMLGGLGQMLFAPPNVKGWDGGIAWISTNTMLERYNHSNLVVTGSSGKYPIPTGKKSTKLKPAKGGIQLPAPVKAAEVLPPSQWQDKRAVVASLERRLLLQPLSAKQRQALNDYLDSQGVVDETDILHTIRMIMCTPEFQLT